MTAIIWIHLAATLWMTGLIWFVQTVHYPLFALVGPEDFGEYHRVHVRALGRLVGPVMILEAFCATWLLVVSIGTAVLIWAAIGWGLLVIIWLSTFCLQVPAHRVLSRNTGNPHPTIQSLTAGNWIRTIGWSARSALAMAWCAWEGAPV
ncbi:MAG: hypothetical protein R3236_00075 [Phycisphaeraceae bacterium]|nr:hypothetical protein [Phycisphaeraceae bacterium]